MKTKKSLEKSLKENIKFEKRVCTIDEVILPTFERKLLYKGLTEEDAKRIANELDKKNKHKHYLIDSEEYRDQRTVKQIAMCVGYDKDEECPRKEEFDNMGPGYFMINPCGMCYGYDRCHAKNKGGRAC